jgi:predicted TPR repeat methyltransferase
MLGKIDEAIGVYKQILALNPASESARYHLAKYGHANAGSDAPTIAPASYVTDLFDQYAATFDEQLVGTLGYQAPTQIGKLFRGLGPHAASLRALDLGCGTGLVAEQLQDLQMQWTGIDLSQKMIATAAKKALYTELHCESIEGYLASVQTPFHLITSADVFIYVGELTSTFKLVSEHLTDNGWFVFSVEKSDQQPLVLRPSGRFAHSEAYLSRLAAQFGLTVQTVAPLTLRFDGNTPIEGLVVALQKLS